MNVRFIKKAAGFFVGLGLFLFGLILSLSLALNTDDGRQLIFSQVNTFLPGTLFVDHLHVSLFSGTLDARGFGLDDPDGHPLVRVKRLYVNLALSSLVMRTLTVEEARIDEPQVFVETDKTGQLNMARAFGIDDGGSSSDTSSGFDLSWNLKLAKLNLNKGRLVYKMSGEETVRIENLEVQADHVNVMRQSGRFSMDMGPCRIRVNEKNLGINSLAVSGNLAKANLSPLSLHLSSDMGDADVKGSIHNLLTHPALDLALILNTSLSDLDTILDLSLGLSGQARLELSLRGDLENPDADVRLTGNALTLLDQRANTLELVAFLKDHRVNISRLNVADDNGTASLTGDIDLKKAYAQGFISSEAKPQDIGYALHLDSVFAHVESLPEVEGIMSGPMKAHIDLEGKGLFPDHIQARADITADSDRLSLWDLPASSYHLGGEVHYEKGVLSVISSRLDSRGNSLTLHGDYRLSEDIWQGALDLKANDLSRIDMISSFGDSAGALDLDSTWSGKGEVWDATFQGRGKALSYEGFFLGDLTTEVLLGSSGILTVNRLLLKQGKAILTGTGQMGVFDELNALDCSISFNHLDLPRILGLTEMKGQADGRLNIGGTFDHPRARMQATGRDLAWDVVHLGRLDVNAVFDRGRLSVTDMTLSNNQSNIQAKGDIQIFSADHLTRLADPVVDISLASESLRLQDFYASTKGQVAVDAHVKGRFGHLEGKAQMTGQSLDLEGQNVDKLVLEVHVDEDDLVVDRADITLAEGEDIRMGGRFSLNDKNYDVSVNSTGLSIKHLGQLGRQAFCEGKITLDLNGQGNLANPGLTGTVELSDFSMNKQTLDGGTVNLDLSDRVAQVTGNLIVDIDTRIQLDTYEFMAQARFDRTELAPFFRIAGYGDLAGNITGYVHADGRLDDPEHIRAKADVSSLTVRSGTVQLIRTDAIHITVADMGFEFPETRFILLDKGDLTVMGRGQMGGELDVSAQGTIPLEVMDPFVEDLSSMAGQVQMSASLKGRIDAPDIQGHVALDSVSFLIPELMQTVHDVNGSIQVSPNEITLETLTGGLDAGKFRIQGSLALDHLEPGALSLEINGDALPFSLPDELDISVNTRMTVTGTPDKTLLEGTLMLIEGRYYKDVSMNLIRMVGEKTRGETPETTPVTAPYLRGMTLDLSVKHRNPFDVDNNIALLELKPDLRVYGTLNHPLISGRAQVGEGVITYQGKEFEVKKGVVDFLNPYKIEPTLDVECQTEIRTWTLTLSVSGTPENLKFMLTSNPSETDGDILSLLLFGKTTQEIKNGGGDSSVSAAQLLSNAISRKLEKNIKDATGMDIVEVNYANSGDQGTENGVSLTIGKELSERLTIKYGVESKNAEAVQRAVSEYKFFENLMINAYQDTANDYGAELVYRLEFR